MERLTPGQPLRGGIPSATWNQYADTSKAIAQAAPTTNTQGSRGAQALKILVSNSTGSDMTADFPIVKLGGPVILPTLREATVYQGLQLEAQIPEIATPIDNLAIVQSNLPNGSFRPAITRGPTYCNVLWTNAGHTHASPTASNEYLISTSSGIRVLWHDTLPEELPAVVRSLVWLDPQGGSANETYRLIRGVATDNVSASSTSFEIDHIVPLAGSRDPREDSSDPDETVEVVNVLNEDYEEGDVVTAIWNGTGWEALAVEKFRLIRGTVYSSVAASSPTVILINVQAIAGSSDPRTDPDDSDEHVTVQNIQKEAFNTGDRVTAIYNGTSPGWEVLIVEKYRAIRGVWYSGTNPLLVNSIQALGGGLDPRSDTTDADEIVNVDNPAGNTYATGDVVEADYCVATASFIARSKGAASGGSSDIRFARAHTDISGATGPLASDWGGGSVFLQDPDTGELDTEDTAVVNPAIAVLYPSGAQVVVVMKAGNNQIINGTCNPQDWADP